MNQPALGPLLQELESPAGSAKPALGQVFSQLPMGGSRTKMQCDGNGTSAERMRVLYLRGLDTLDRYAANKSQWHVWRLC
jgi:hypothetical protein